MRFVRFNEDHLGLLTADDGIVDLTDRLGIDADDPLEFVREVHAPWTRRPDATLYLDVAPETGARRAGATDKLEQVDFLEAVSENYEQLIADDPDRFVRIDAERPHEDVLADVEATVARLLE